MGTKSTDARDRRMSRLIAHCKPTRANAGMV